MQTIFFWQIIPQILSQEPHGYHEQKPEPIEFIAIAKSI